MPPNVTKRNPCACLGGGSDFGMKRAGSWRGLARESAADTLKFELRPPPLSLWTLGRSLLRPLWHEARTAAVLVAVVLAASVARAENGQVDDATRNAARELARDAVTAYDAQEYEKALDLLQRAHDLVPAPTITLYQARCLSRLGRLVEAMERYEATRRAPLDAKAPPAFREAVRDAGKELEEVRARVPKAKIVVEGPGSDSQFMQVMLDGKVVPPALVGVARTIDPGAHRIEVRVPGVSRGLTNLSIEEGEVEDVRVRLVLLGAADDDYTGAEQDRATRNESSSRKTWGYVGIGVGVAGLALGATAALMARSKQDDLDAACDGSRCPPSAQDDLDSFRSRRTLSLVGYGVGAVGVIAGSALLLWPDEKKGREGRAIAPWVGVGSAGLGGRF